MELLTKRYVEKIAGVLDCYDRIVVKGTLPTICYPEGMTRYLQGMIFVYSITPDLQSRFVKK